MSSNFYRMLLLLLVASVSVVHSQPVSCTDNTHCQENHYCDLSTFNCNECIKCEQHKRVTLIKPSSNCSQSITDCGNCVSGYTENKGECIPYENKSSSQTSDYKTYLVVCVVVIFIGVLLVITVFIYIKKDKLFNLSHMTSVEWNHNGLQKVIEPPPVYTPTAPTAPAATEGLDTGSSWPLLNKNGPLSQSTRLETVGDQRASVTDPPAYVRNSEIGVDENVPPGVSVSPYEEEETRDSFWTPSNNTNNNTNDNNTIALPTPPEAGQPSLSMQLAAVRGTQLIHVASNAPSSQLALSNIPSVSQETDNNGNQEDSRQSGTASRNNTISVNQIFNFHSIP